MSREARIEDGAWTPDPETIAQLERTNALAIRVRQAATDAGFDPDILDALHPSYVAAALILGVKD